MTITYEQAGVNIDAGNQLVKTISPKIKKTFSSEVLNSIGGFGALFDLKEIVQNYKHPVLVQSIDGVGTKTIVAKMANHYHALGQDLLSATSNDILVLGAKTLTILDYIANDMLVPETVDQIISGLCEACINENVSLVGGETAEMPDTYRTGEHDIVGVVTGVVDKDKIIDGKSIRPGDKVYGFAASGLHTNGFSLARKILFTEGKLNCDHFLTECNQTVGEVLLAPHLNYASPIHHLLKSGINIKGLSHITGGGMIDNIPRILPNDTAVEIHEGSWQVLPIFDVMAYIGNVAKIEMYRTFNMGIGMVMISDRPKKNIDAALKTIGHEPVVEIGDVVPGSQEVHLA